MKTIEERRSIRSFTKQTIEDEKLMAVLEAGRIAPSAMNRQMWHFYVVTNPTLIDKLQVNCRDQKQVGEAPITLVICSTQERVMSCGQKASTVDCSIALSMMMLEAVEQGLGMCWLGSFDELAVKATLNIPNEYDVVAITPLGYPNESPAAKPRKTLEEIVSYIN